MVIGAARECVHIEGEPLPDAEDLGNYTNTALWPAAFWNRLVVHPDFWGQGLSRLIDKARLEWAEKGPRTIDLRKLRYRAQTIEISTVGI
jgi:GNAT superfamily N-acetyltransferase